MSLSSSAATPSICSPGDGVPWRVKHDLPSSCRRFCPATARRGALKGRRPCRGSFSQQDDPPPCRIVVIIKHAGPWTLCLAA
jgi:hypothetical protein